MRNNKLFAISGNAIWQMMPALTSFLLSFVVVRLYSVNVWGQLVQFFVIQQTINAFLSWGNKDFLQKKMADSPANFNQDFTQLFAERFAFMILTFGVVLVLNLSISPAMLCVMVFAQFLRQSCDVLVLNSKQFPRYIGIDVLTLFLLLTMVFLSGSITLLLQAVVFSHLARSLVLIASFRAHFVRIEASFRQIPKALSFAMVGLSGFFATKLDLMIFTRVFGVNKDLLGTYQILISFVWLIQSGAMFIGSAYVPHYYRVPKSKKTELARKLFGFGVVLVIVAMIAVKAVFSLLYHIDLSWGIIFVSAVLALTAYLLSPIIYDLFLSKKQMFVAVILFLGSLLMGVMIFTLNYFREVGLFEAIMIVCLNKLIILLVFYLQKRRLQEYNL